MSWCLDVWMSDPKWVMTADVVFDTAEVRKIKLEIEYNMNCMGSCILIHVNVCVVLFGLVHLTWFFHCFNKQWIFIMHKSWFDIWMTIILYIKFILWMWTDF